MSEPDRTVDYAEVRPLEAGAAEASTPEPEPADAAGATPTHRERRARFHERRAAAGRHAPAPWIRLRGPMAVKLAVVLSFMILLGVLVAKKVHLRPNRVTTLAKRDDGGKSNDPPATAIPPRDPAADRPDPASPAPRPRQAARVRPAPRPIPLPDLPGDPPAEVVQVDHKPATAPLAIPDPPVPAPAPPEPAAVERAELAADGPQGPATETTPPDPTPTPEAGGMPDLPVASAPTPAPARAQPRPGAQTTPAPSPAPSAPAIAPEPVAVIPPAPASTPTADEPARPEAPAPAIEVAGPAPEAGPPELSPTQAPSLAADPGTSEAPGALPDLGARRASAAAADGPSPIELVKEKDRSRWIPLPNAGPRRGPAADPIASTDRAADAGSPGRVPPPSARVDPQAGSVLHMVREGEDFGTIARDFYTSSRFRKALWAFNRRRVPAEDALTAGTTLVIPVPEALDPALIAPPGSGSAPELVGARDRDRGRGRGAREANPREVELMLPVSRPVAEPVPLDGEPARRPTCLVHEGETLRSIARETLGDPHREGEILDLNRRKIPDPRHLSQGIRLALPDDADTGRRLR